MDAVKVANPLFTVDGDGEDDAGTVRPDAVVLAGAAPVAQPKSWVDSLCCCRRSRADSTGQGAVARAALGDETPLGEELKMLKVSGVAESDEAALRKIFEEGGYGELGHVFIRHRWDQEKDENTSWAILTSESVATADRIVRASPISADGRTLTVERYDAKKGQASRGAMRMVQRMTAQQVDADVLEEINRRMDSLSGPVQGMKLAVKQVERTGVIAHEVIAEMQQVRGLMQPPFDCMTSISRCVPCGERARPLVWFALLRSAWRIQKMLPQRE
jgi:hypothetical protein